MKKYILAIVIASGALFAVSAQAAPVSTGASDLQNQVASSVEKVRHCRYWSGGWGCGWGHRRWWSHRRWGSGGWHGHSRYWSHRRRGSYWR